MNEILKSHSHMPRVVEVKAGCSDSTAKGEKSQSLPSFDSDLVIVHSRPRPRSVLAVDNLESVPMCIVLAKTDVNSCLQCLVFEYMQLIAPTRQDTIVQLPVGRYILCRGVVPLSYHSHSLSHFGCWCMHTVYEEENVCVHCVTGHYFECRDGAHAPKSRPCLHTHKLYKPNTCIYVQALLQLMALNGSTEPHVNGCAFSVTSQ